jgi:hypothetical protein
VCFPLFCHARLKGFTSVLNTPDSKKKKKKVVQKPSVGLVSTYFSSIFIESWDKKFKNSLFTKKLKKKNPSLFAKN